MNPDTSSELLSRLRDIHGAAEAPFWPPAPGWWVLAALLLLGGFWLARRGLARWHARRRRERLLEALTALRERHDPGAEPDAWLSAVNRLLKIVALRSRATDGVAALSGADWVRYLGDEEDADAFAALAEGPYRPRPEFDAGALEQAAARWIRRHG